MENHIEDDQAPFSSYEFQPDAISIQDALIILSIRAVGGNLHHDPSLKQQILAQARKSPLFEMEDFEQTEGRLTRFANWAGSPAMETLFPEALRKLQGEYRRPALTWTVANALNQGLSDESQAILHHIGQALGFSADEVESELERMRRDPLR
jgi:hypothetical protein